MCFIKSEIDINRYDNGVGRMRKLQLILVAFSGVAMVVLFLLAGLVELNVNSIRRDHCDDYIGDWIDETGERVSLYEIFDKDDQNKTFVRDLDGKTVNGRDLCLISHNVSFSVWLDDKKIYSYDPELGGIYGKRYGQGLHTVNIPTFTDTRQLRIEAESLNNDGTSGFNEAYLENSRDFLNDLAAATGVKFSLCVMTFLFGLLLFVVGVVEDRLCGNMLEAMCLGAITMVVSMWVGSQTLIMRVLVQNAAMLRVIEYISLAVLPIPVLLFVAHYTKNANDKRVMALVTASAVNTALTLTLVCAGLVDYYDLLIITHIIIATGVLLIIYLVIRTMQSNKIDRRKSLYLISALTVLMLSGILDMVMYYVADTNGTAYLTVIGLIVFSTILAVYEYRHIINIQIRSSKAELMQTLAMQDPLTGIGSRTAFVAYEEKLMNRRNGKCLFVHFDVNNLKRVNDVYGHAEGDRHIIGAANVIKSGFGDYGTIYRVGGDEFFAVLDHIACVEEYSIALAKFTRAQHDYNTSEDPPVHLSIAYGMAEYDYSEQNPENAERLADSRMYEKKREMKSVGD